LSELVQPHPIRDPADEAGNACQEEYNPFRPAGSVGATTGRADAGGRRRQTAGYQRKEDRDANFEARVR
jgi:hypothetical protein